MTSTNYVLQVESVRGETRRNGKDDLIEILAFEYGISAGHFQGEPGHKRRTYTNVRFKKLIDRASVTIQQMLAQNSNIRQATLTLSKSGGTEPLVFFKLVLKDGYFTSYKVRGEESADEYASMPREEFEISFGRIEIEYAEQNEKGLKGGSVNFADDIATNE